MKGRVRFGIVFLIVLSGMMGVSYVFPTVFDLERKVMSTIVEQKQQLKNAYKLSKAANPNLTTPNRDYYVLPRSYNCAIPISVGLRSALEFKEQQLQTLSLQKATFGNQWTFIGPRNTAGRVLCVRYHPTDPNIVYCGSASGGLWKSTDGGFSWTALTDKFTTLAISSIAIDKTNPETIYIGTGEGANNFDHVYGDGVYKSSDGGYTWTNIMKGIVSDVDLAINCIELVPSDPNMIYVAASYGGSNGGMFRSTDGGKKWINILSGPARSVRVDPFDSKRVVVAYGYYNGSSNNGIYISESYGDRYSFKKVTVNLPKSDSIGNLSFDFSRSKQGTIVALMALAPKYANPVERDFLGVFRSSDGGANWERSVANTSSTMKAIFRAQGDYNLHVHFHPADHNTIFIGGIDTWRSMNFGDSWSQISFQNDPTYSAWADQHDADFNPQDPNMMLVCSDGGVFRARNNKGNKVPFEEFGLDLGTMQFYGMDFDKKNTGRVVGGTQDRRNNLGSVGNLDWTRLSYGGDGGYTAFDYTNSQIFYIESQFGAIGKTTNGGASFSGAQSGLVYKDGSGNDLFAFAAPFLVNPKDSRMLFIAGNRIYRTLNRAGSWVEISDDLTTVAGWWNQFQDIAVCKNDPNFFYGVTGSNPRVFASKTATETDVTWTNVTANLPRLWFSAVAVHPTDGNTAYIGTSAFDSKSGVYKTTNGGVSWTFCTGETPATSLPKIPVGALAVYEKDPQVVFAGTDLGVYVTRDGGKNWSPFGEGLPNVVIDDIKITPDDIIYAATHGRGMWMSNAVLSVNNPRTPESFKLDQNYPNPFNPGTTIPFSLNKRDFVSIQLFDSRGKLIKTLLNEYRNAGSHDIYVNATGLESGVYMYTLACGSEKQTRKMILMK